jgi:hypothetical protein
MTSKAIIDIMLKQRKHGRKLNLGCLHHTLACHELSCCGQDNGVCFSKTYQVLSEETGK